MNTHTVLQPLVALVFVLVVALVLMLYVASVDALQSYGSLLLERVISSAEIIEYAIEPLLQSGLPLSQLVGFDVITNPIIFSDEVIYDISIIDNTQSVLFQNSKEDYVPVALSDYTIYQSNIERQDVAIYRSADAFQVRVPLDARFNQPGTLLLTTPTFVISQFINNRLRIVMFFALFVVIGYTAVLFSTLRSKKSTTLLVNAVYNISMAIVSIILIISLIQIYSSGVQQKAKALVDSLSVRLGAIYNIGLDIEDFSGINEVFVNYKRLNPDIEFISLARDNTIVVHTDPEEVSTSYEADYRMIEYAQHIGPDSGVAVSVAIPRNLIFIRLIRNIKNLGVLFLASAFLSWLLLRILLALYPNIRSDIDGSSLQQTRYQDNILMELISPTFFLANFIEGLHYSYLPQFFSQIAIDSGAGVDRIGGLYALYWAMYAIVLIPAGRLARTFLGIRFLLITGFIFVAISMVSIVLLPQFALLYFFRAIAGLGQGMIFIAVQSYILQQSSEHRRTQGVSIIVFGYNGGIISGTIIGALLVASLGFNRLFLVSAAVALLMVWYSAVALKSSHKVPERAQALPDGAPGANYTAGKPLVTQEKITRVAWWQGAFYNMKMLFADREFTKTILFVGLTTKAVLTGVIFLALPYFLNQLDYLKDDIGQIIMFYAIGVLLVSRLAARYTDRLGNTRLILFCGSFGSAVGLLIIASVHLQAVAQSFVLQTLALISGTLLVGISHGFVHAPIITHITQARVSEKLGGTVVASIYRFMERIGHVLGPLIFGKLLLQSADEIGSIYYIAIIVAIFSLLFFLIPTKTRKIN